MPTGKTCGNCANFVRIKGWGGSRNGLCGAYDYNCHSDSAYAKGCTGYSGIKHERKRHSLEEATA